MSDVSEDQPSYKYLEPEVKKGTLVLFHGI